MLPGHKQTKAGNHWFSETSDVTVSMRLPAFTKCISYCTNEISLQQDLIALDITTAILGWLSRVVNTVELQYIMNSMWCTSDKMTT